MALAVGHGADQASQAASQCQGGGMVVARGGPVKPGGPAGPGPPGGPVGPRPGGGGPCGPACGYVGPCQGPVPWPCRPGLLACGSGWGQQPNTQGLNADPLKSATRGGLWHVTLWYDHDA